MCTVKDFKWEVPLSDYGVYDLGIIESFSLEKIFKIMSLSSTAKSTTKPYP